MGKTDAPSSRKVPRRVFLTGVLATPLIAGNLDALADGRRSDSAPSIVRLLSPNRQVRLEVSGGGPSRLTYSVSLNESAVIEPSAAGIVLDGVDLGQRISIGRIERYRISERYPWRGGHSEAVNHANCAKIELSHQPSNTRYTLEIRVFDDGIAFRHVVPADRGTRVPDEATAFKLPEGSTVWYHDFEGHYEGVHSRRTITEVKSGEWAAPPLTIKLPGGSGYAAISEAALISYSGMGLQCSAPRTFSARLGHSIPASYPFRLRYPADQERLANPAAFDGAITTPWRVVMAGATLNVLVNCDIVNSLSPPPDPVFFPKGLNTDWLKPGRAVWKYLDGGENTLEGMKEFSRLAAELGFEYNVVEGFWQRWDESQMRELAEYSRQRGVGVWFWKHSRDLRSPDAREQFFTLLNRVGVIGAKIDFFDHEAKEIVDLYQALLRDAARHKIMVDFHGANKPAGESRTWPNEMTREAIRGLEASKMPARAVHNTTLPFTRLLAGHADYTPVVFGERRRETSWAHQIASAAVFTSPVLIYGAHPRSLLENPAAGLIKSIPSVWDETIALPGCEIGELAAFARRHRDDWFLAVMNGPSAKTLKIPLTFLQRGVYQGSLVRDRFDEPAAVKLDTGEFSRTEVVEVALRPAGGFIARFARRTFEANRAGSP